MRRWLSAARERWVAIGLLAIAVALFASAMSGDRGLVRIAALRAELRQVNDRNFQLLQEISRTRSQLQAIRTEPEALERLARQRLGLVRDGETLYQIEQPHPGRNAAR